MAIFQAKLGKPVAPSIALAGRWGCRKLLQPVPHPLISTTMVKGFWCKVFMHWMPFLLPNQQRHSTDGKFSLHIPEIQVVYSELV